MLFDTSGVVVRVGARHLQADKRDATVARAGGAILERILVPRALQTPAMMTALEEVEEGVELRAGTLVERHGQQPCKELPVSGVARDEAARAVQRSLHHRREAELPQRSRHSSTEVCCRG